MAKEEPEKKEEKTETPAEGEKKEEEVKRVEKIKRLPKPDEEANKKEVDAIKEKIQTLQDKNREYSRIFEEKKEIQRGARAAQEAVRNQLRATRDRRNVLIDEKRAIREQMGPSPRFNDLKKQDQNKKGQRPKMSLIELEDKIRSLEYQHNTSSMSLQAEKKLLAEIKLLKDNKKDVAEYEMRQNAFKIAREEDRKKRDVLGEEIGISNAKIDKVREEEEKFKNKLDNLREREKNEVGDLSGLLAQKDANKAEIDAHYDKIRTITGEFRQKMREWKDNDYAVRQQQREIKQAAWKKRQAERQAEYEARKKDEEDSYVDADPYDEEKKICDTLIDYLTHLAPKVEAKKEAKEIDYGADHGKLMGKKAKDADADAYWSELQSKGKKKGMQKKKRGKSNKSQVTKQTLSHPLEKLAAFDTLGMKVPLNPELLTSTIEELKAKKLSFDALAKEGGGKKVNDRSQANGRIKNFVNLKINTKANAIKLTIDVL